MTNFLPSASLWETITKVDPDPIAIAALRPPPRSSNRRRHNAGPPPQVSSDPTGNTPFFDEDDGFDSFDEYGDGADTDDDGDWQGIRVEELMGPNSPYHGLSLDEIIRRLEVAYGMVKRPLNVGRINQFPLVSISEEQASKSKCRSNIYGLLELSNF